ncbi:hypothetical protein ACWERI_19885 [Streptomyces collinus]
MAWRTRRVAVTVLPVACAAALSVPYLLLIDYSAPRFLLPAYALLAVPLATLAADGVRAVGRPRLRAVAVALAVVALVLHLGTQAVVLGRNVADARATAGQYRTAASDLHRLGLAAPCLVSGEHAPPIGYYTGCASANVSGNNRDTGVPALLRRAAREPSAALARTRSGPPHYARTWTSHRLPGTGLTAYLPARHG